MAAYYSFSEHDMDIINRHRRSHNKLGFAVQLCVLRYPGWSLTEIDSIPFNVLRYIAKQIDVDPNVFQFYARREPTKREHIDEIRKEYGYKSFSSKEYRQLCTALASHAMENGDAIYLVKAALEELRKEKVILPAIAAIERAVWEVRDRAEKKLHKDIHACLSPEQIQGLDDLLNTKSDNGVTRLVWLKEVPKNFSPDAFVNVINRIECIRTINLTIDVSSIHPNRLRQLSRLGSRYEPYAFKKFEEKKRYSMLVIFLLDLLQDLTDQAVEIHDKQMNNLLTTGRKTQNEMQVQNGKNINEKLNNYVKLVDVLDKAKSEGSDPYKKIEENIMPWDKLVSSGKEAERLTRPEDYDYLDLIESKYGHLRKYTPLLLKSLNFEANKSTQPLIEALNVIKDMNAGKKLKVPQNAPLDFVPNRWLKHVLKKDGGINKHYYEMAALSELKDCIRSGDVSVTGSRQYKNFDDYLLSKESWEQAKKKGTRLAISLDFKEYIGERMNTLDEKLQGLSKNMRELKGVVFEKKEFHVERLEKDTPEEAKKFGKLLYSLLPRIKITELLSEVDNMTGFLDKFVHASSGRKPREDEKPIIMASLVAMGMNVGLVKMAEATPGISYYQMAHAVEWRMSDDSASKSQATLVNFQHSLDMSFCWGDGTTSSSDGMHLKARKGSLFAETNYHYGPGKGSKIYRWVSDQGTSYNVSVIRSNSREGIHFIDGVLHHETDLNIKEHYTDTSGYTDQIFGLCHLLGIQFMPRIRDLPDSKLYSFEKPSIYPKLEGILKGKIQMKVMEENWDDVLRLANTVMEGKSSASLLMSKLGSYARQNSLAAALSEVGRIEKTIFILNYISSEALRRRIQRGLNKGESMNALARAIFFGKRGEMYERALKEQLQRASALNILINAIVVWNTVYLEKAIEYLRSCNMMREDLMGYVLPLGWEHINFLGEYSFSMDRNRTLGNLRPLNELKNIHIP